MFPGFFWVQDGHHLAGLRRPLRAGLPADLQPVLKKIEDSGGAGGSMYFVKSAGSCWFWAIPSGKQSQKTMENHHF